MIYGDLAPAGDLWDGVYLDDLWVVLKCFTEEPIDPKTFVAPAPSRSDPDLQRMAQAEKAYAQASLRRAEHKAFRALTNFKAWGQR